MTAAGPGLTFVASGLRLLVVSARTPGGLISNDADVDLFKAWPRCGYGSNAVIYEDLQDATSRGIALEFHTVTAGG